ncbi:unnamed protein product [Caenorhabditis auriculariae]|uniref:ANK_REP_REGION domain-containing protein n=1 Tax=Caenorhabditis auriculariae TaxID=2777116 RepID=A0A8S1H209_9PELO|nr:unnamed protein product [Caenorhabditis auriculariae]
MQEKCLALKKIDYKSLQKELLHATKKRDLNKIKSLAKGRTKIHLKRSLNLRCHYNFQPLVLACQIGFYEGARLLIRLGADPLNCFRTATTERGQIELTPLRYAIQKVGTQKCWNIFKRRSCKNFKVVRALVEGGKLDLKMPAGNNQESPLFLACAYSNLSLVKYFCQRGAKVEDRNIAGSTCIMVPEYFRKEKSRKIFKYLIKQGLSVDAVNSDGETALHLAVKARNSFLVALLTAEGAKLVRNNDGETPLHTAALQACEILEHLTEYADDKKAKKDALLLNFSAKCFRSNGKIDKNALEVLKKALKINVPAEEEVVPNPAFDSLREAVSITDYKAAKSHNRYNHMQCFIILERILGPGNEILRKNLLEYCFHADKIQCFNMRYNALRCYTISLYQKYSKPLSEGLIDALSFFSGWIENWDEIRNAEKKRTALKMAAFLFDELCFALETAHKEHIHNQHRDEWGEKFAGYVLDILSKISSLGFDAEEADKLKGIGIDLRRFARIASLLHITVFHMRNFMGMTKWITVARRRWRLCSLRRIRILSCVFFDVFSTKVGLDSGTILLRFKTPVYREFLTNGARIFVEDRDEDTVFEHLQENVYEADPIIVGNFITLKDICALAVEKEYSESFLRKALPLNLHGYFGFNDCDDDCFRESDFEGFMDPFF